ncbi:hypothetical protein BDN70DRAFT_876848 [Pholiota conissans]|uniref:T6SS Phospholipase effector Tle1-like catalytic domain-containing protein n=1 Tax=Pholiota conissans TaxID=109636 RepID=A0A9P6CVP9_9AGAR|nr:hypothetical protein BDN70DRAFT_876848 [Pholiota conissans]
MTTTDVTTPPSPAKASLLLEESLPSRVSGSPSRSPRRIETAPELQPDKTLHDGAVEGQPRQFKRILVFCDGTWQDGISSQRSAYTNVLRLARSVKHEDTRHQKDGPPVTQVVFYQAGIGSDKNIYSEYVEGTTGCTLGDKVEDAYAFIAHNYCPGDEIYLFGFSRGAYTARMIAMFIGAIGVLSRSDMDHFSSIFLNFQKLGLCKKEDTEEKAQLKNFLAPWLDPASKGHKRASLNGKKVFTVKCLGVWDTVGSVGLPEELTMMTKPAYHLFGFPDRLLGEHIEAAYQALAINEMRADFSCSKFVQTDAGKAKGQVLKQTWFTGCHSDIGGGYKDHDLSDITLTWMAAHIDVNVALDIDYLRKLIRPVAPWGAQVPHDSATGVFKVAATLQRTLPVVNDPQTEESIHLSVLEQTDISPALVTLAGTIKAHPKLVSELMTLEELVRNTWPYDPNTKHARKYAEAKDRLTNAPSLEDRLEAGTPVEPTKRQSWFGSIVRSISSSSSISRHSRSLSVASTAATEVEEVHTAATVVKDEKVHMSKVGSMATIKAETTTTATATTNGRFWRMARRGRRIEAQS